MAFKIKLRNISVSNTFRVFYRKGRTPGSVTVQSGDWNTNGGIYVGEYSSSTTSVDITVPNIEYGAQYWVKILDMITGSYIVENIYIHEFEYYRFCETCCDFSGGTSNFISYEVTPTPTPLPPTPTPTPIPTDCTLTGGTSDFISYDSTPTPTPIPPTATPTPLPPTPTPTPTTTGTSNWTVANDGCGLGTVNDIGINGSFMNSLSGSNFPLTSTLSGTKLNPNGINYGGANTIQANVTTNIAGNGNCAVLTVTVNGNLVGETYFTSNPFPQVSGIIIPTGATVLVKVTCYPFACPE